MARKQNAPATPNTNQKNSKDGSSSIVLRVESAGGFVLQTIPTVQFNDLVNWDNVKKSTGATFTGRVFPMPTGATGSSPINNPTGVSCTLAATICMLAGNMLQHVTPPVAKPATAISSTTGTWSFTFSITDLTNLIPGPFVLVIHGSFIENTTSGVEVTPLAGSHAFTLVP